MAKKARLIDTTKCIGCKSCQVACKNWNQLPATQTEFTGSLENPPDLHPEIWSRVKFNEYADNDSVKWYFSFISCMHCAKPGCMPVCPANAIIMTELGVVKVDQERCIGCGLCKTACPFHIPRVGDLSGKSVAWKCTFCYDRISNGQTTACAKACPTGALSFGDLNDKLAEAEERVAILQQNGNTHSQIYGKDEMGGLSAIYVLADSPDKYGLPVDPHVSLGSHIWNIALRPVKFLATMGITIGVINNLISKRELKTK